MLRHLQPKQVLTHKAQALLALQQQEETRDPVNPDFPAIAVLPSAHQALREQDLLHQIAAAARTQHQVLQVVHRLAELIAKVPAARHLAHQLKVNLLLSLVLVPPAHQEAVHPRATLLPVVVLQARPVVGLEQAARFLVAVPHQLPQVVAQVKAQCQVAEPRPFQVEALQVPLAAVQVKALQYLAAAHLRHQEVAAQVGAIQFPAAVLLPLQVTAAPVKVALCQAVVLLRPLAAVVQAKALFRAVVPLRLPAVVAQAKALYLAAVRQARLVAAAQVKAALCQEVVHRRHQVVVAQAKAALYQEM